MDELGIFREWDSSWIEIGDTGEEGGVGSIDVESRDGDTDLEVCVESIGNGDGSRSPREEQVLKLLIRDDSLYG